MIYSNMVKPDYFPALTGLRAFASFWVLAYHIYHVLPQLGFLAELPIISALVLTGYQGADMFFVLSGFIIAHHYAGQLHSFSWARYRSYLWARVARIYPLHVVTLLMVLVMIKSAPFMNVTINREVYYSTMDFVLNLFLIQAWQFPAHVSWNHFAWSISAEWFAYLLAPFFVALIWTKQRYAELLLIAILFLLITPTMVHFFPEIKPSAFALFRVTGAFGAGMVAYRFFKETNVSLNEWLTFILLVISIIVQGYLAERVEFITVPFATLFIFAIARQRGALSAFFKSKEMEYFGKISYALYMTQFIILMPMKKILPAIIIPKLAGLYAIGMCIGSIILAMAAYHFIEEPARKYLRKLY